jgi:rod shape-determining protein MreD
VTIPLLAGAALLQTVTLSHVDLGGGRPDLVLLLALVWAFMEGSDRGALWGFLGGLMLGLLSGGPLGATALALLVGCFVTGQRWGQGLGIELVRLLLLAFAGALTYHLVLLAALALTGHAVAWMPWILRVAIPSALLNALLSPFVWQPFRWLDRRSRRRGLLA